MIPTPTSQSYALARATPEIEPRQRDDERPYPGPKGEDLTRRIRARYSYYMAAWEQQREAAKLDTLLMANEPFDEREIRRRGKKRPLVLTDQVGQYTNQIIGQIQQNPRGVNFSPMDFATDKEVARKWGNLARGIEKDSDAQSVYSTAFEGAVAYGGMGFMRLSQEYESCDSDQQVLRLKRVPNHASILPDPDCQKIDFADMKCCFVLDRMKHQAWLDEYEDAQQRDFGAFLGDEQYKLWISDNDLTAAEFWEVIEEPDTLLVMRDSSMLFSELPEGAEWFPAHKTRGSLGGTILYNGTQLTVKSWRKTKVPSVWRHMTNGVEVTDSYEWAWKSSSIPIYPVVGREMFVDRGEGPKKQYVSAVRFVRWAVKGMAYVRSLQMEIAQQTPKTPYIAIEGQLDDMEGWKTLNTDPAAFLYYKAKLATYPGAILPPPTRLAYDPRLEPLEALYQAFKQDLEGGMGMYRASVGNQTGSTSGKMVEELDRQSDQGSFHFTHNFNQTLERAWTDIKDRIPDVYDTARDVPGVRADGTAEVIRLNDPDHEGAIFTKRNKLAVSVSVGAAMDQQTKDQQKLAEQLIPLEGAMAKAGDLIVGLMSNGPQIDQIAERFKPMGVDDGEQSPEQVKQQLMQTQQELQAAQQALQIAAKKLEVDQIKADNDFRKAQLQQEHEDKRSKEDNDTRIKVALINQAAALDKHDAVMEDNKDARADAADAQVTDRVMDAAEGEAERGHQSAEGDAERGHQADMMQQQQEHASLTQAADQDFQAQQAEAAAKQELDSQGETE